jgi:hypothetical protein
MNTAWRCHKDKVTKINKENHMPKTELQKLNKKLEKLEKEYDVAPALRKARIYKSAEATQARIDKLTWK